MEKKLKVTTVKQFETLVAELEKNTSLAKGFVRSSNPNKSKQEWEEIALKLNSLGPPIRDSDGWQKVWRDFKCQLKKKLSHNKAEMNGTGGGIYKQLPLTPLEEAAANFLQFEKQLSPEGKIQGIIVSVDEVQTENVADVYMTIFEDEENDPITMATSIQIQKETISNMRKTKQKRSEREELFQEHNAIHKEAFHQISNTMTEINTTLKENYQNVEKLWERQENTMMEIKNTLKEPSRYQRKLWEVEERKMKMMEKHYQREEKLFDAEIELKK